MSSSTKAESQPLMEKGSSWQNTGNSTTETHFFVDSLHNGLNKRIEKNCEATTCAAECIVSIQLPTPERDERSGKYQFPPEKWKTLLAGIFLTASMAWTLTILSIVHERMPDRAAYPPLPDIFFDVFPEIDWALNVSEYIILFAVSLTLFIIIVHKHRFIILRRCFLIIGVLYFMRSITMFVTQVPVASTTYFCHPKENSTNPLRILKRVLYMMSGFGLSINGRHIYCGDYVYSGHTVILAMAYLIIKEYSPRRCIILHWLVWLLSCIGVFFVLLARGHYMVDIVVAYYATTRVFWIYHTMANNAILREPGNNNFLSKIWWFTIFTFFENNVRGVVPRQYEWPLAWPRRFLRHTRIS